jgi:transcriptional regulator with XRE-family HTH domain
MAISEWNPHEDIVGRVRRNESEILRASRTATQQRVADLLGVSAATVSRYHEADPNGISFVRKCSAFLAACGLKVIPEAHQHYSPDHIAALRVLARERLDNSEPISQFGVEP